MIKIVGAKGKVKDVEGFLKKIQDFSKRYQIVIQVVDADLVYGKDHLVSASNHALRAFERGKNSTDSLSMEILLYASGERQIQKAIHKMGIKKGEVDIAFVLIDGVQETADGGLSDTIVHEILRMLNLLRDDKVLEGNRDTLKRFGITQQELMTLPAARYGDLILEKVALVDVIK